MRKVERRSELAGNPQHIFFRELVMFFDEVLGEVRRVVGGIQNGLRGEKINSVRRRGVVDFSDIGVLADGKETGLPFQIV